MLKLISLFSISLICASAASFNFNGTFTSDGQLRLFDLTLLTDSTISVRTYGYGGSTSPITPAGGFAPSLALYNFFGDIQASDTTGGTWNGSSCSNGAQRDPVTGFCQDASFSFNGIAGNYTLILSVQGNNGPSVITDPFTLSPGDNFNPGPFADPGDATGLTIRNGNWALEISINGSTNEAPVPEPSTTISVVLGIVALALARRCQQ